MKHSGAHTDLCILRSGISVLEVNVKMQSIRTSSYIWIQTRLALVQNMSEHEKFVRSLSCQRNHLIFNLSQKERLFGQFCQKFQLEQSDWNAVVPTVSCVHFKMPKHTLFITALTRGKFSIWRLSHRWNLSVAAVNKKGSKTVQFISMIATTKKISSCILPSKMWVNWKIHQA